MNNLDLRVFQEKYNNEPVLYCSHCLSLRIRQLENIQLDYCDHCGSTDILERNIKEWEILYKNKYGHNYIELKNERKK